MPSPARRWVFALLSVFIAVPTAFAGITGSKHDLSMLGGGEIKSPDIGFSCYYCHSVHTPDEGSGGDGGYPMWNKNLDALGPYSVYSSSTLDTAVAARPNLESLACLSCHDGTVALNVIKSGVLGTLQPTDILAGRDSDLGTDLQNDHPISFVLDNTVDSELHTLTTAKSAGLKFFGGEENRVECATCHNPHNPTHEPFLRLSNEMSALCLSCHAK